MSLFRRTKHLLSLYNFVPKKKLGQNFLVDVASLERMIFYANLSKEHVVLELGAGLGFLTRHLSPLCKRLIAVEVDSRLVEILRRQLRGFRNVELIEGDVLKVQIPRFDKLVSVPPYSLSSPLMFWLLEKKFDCAVFVFQKEFAERLIAPLGGRKYGRLTVIAQYLSNVELLDIVPRRMFYPTPEVDSVILRLKSKKAKPFPVCHKTFFEFVTLLFTQKNKKLKNSIVPFLRKRGVKRENAVVLSRALPFSDKKVRNLAPEEFGSIFNELFQKKILF